MSDDPFEGRTFPRGILIGAAVMIGFTISVAAFVRLTGIGKSELEFAEVVKARTLYFDDQGSGTITVYTEGQPIATLDSGEDGFIFGVLRGLGRHRKVQSIDTKTPFVVSLRADGRLLLEDPETGDQLDLRAYGQDNRDAFAALLNAEIKLPDPAAAVPTDH